MAGMSQDLSRTAPDQLDWSSELSHRFFPLEISPRSLEASPTQVRLREFPHSKFAEISLGAHTASMSARGCSRLTHRYVKVIWLRQGGARLEQNGRAVDLAPNHWTVYDASRPYEVQMAEDAAFTVLLCESGPHDALMRLAQRSAGRLMPTEGGAAVMLATLQATCNEARNLMPVSCSVVIDFAVALLTRELQFGESGLAESRRRAQEVLLRAAEQYLRANLSRQQLSPDHIAAALHVSRRTLYHAFELVGETPQALIRRLRLEQCRDMLGHNASAGISITQLALEFGFSDPAYFTRCFRQRFGCTPSQYRADSLKTEIVAS